MIVHVCQYRVVPGHEAEFVAYLRYGVARDVSQLPGLLAAYVGRRLGPTGQEHAAATVWDGPTAFAEGVDEHGLPRFLSPRAQLIESPAGEAYDVVQDGRGVDPRARLLRISRFALEPGNDGWFAERSALTLHTVIDQGGVAAYAGVLRPAPGPPDLPEAETEGGEGGEGGGRVLIVSVWPSWEGLLTATGGRSSRPLLQPSEEGRGHVVSIDHYELIDADNNADGSNGVNGSTGSSGSSAGRPR